MFFDLEKAYDTTWRHGILLSLYDIDFRGRLPIFIQQILSRPLLRVRVGSVFSETSSLEKDVPQGSILSVLLSAVVINGVIDVLLNNNHCSLYVKNLSISFSASWMSLIKWKLQLRSNQPGFPLGY